MSVDSVARDDPSSSELMDQTRSLVDQMSPPEAKIALFRSLFRGRDDVYPRRFESRKTGKSGYAPACSNEWVRGICEKPRVKCAECPSRRFLPVMDAVIRWHLSGYDDAGQLSRAALSCRGPGQGAGLSARWDSAFVECPAETGLHGHSDHRCAREPGLSCVRSLTGALASAGGHGTPR